MSRWPSVVMSAVREPFRSISVLVMSVVPCTTSDNFGVEEGMEAWTWRRSSTRTVVTASPGSSGVVSDFPTQMRPEGDNTATPSVNVPPISTAIRREVFNRRAYRSGFFLGGRRSHVGAAPAREQLARGIVDVRLANRELLSELDHASFHRQVAWLREAMVVHAHVERGHHAPGPADEREIGCEIDERPEDPAVRLHEARVGHPVVAPRGLDLDRVFLD